VALTKILWGQIVVVVLVALAVIWGATEWTAWRLGFQQQLRPAWFTLADLPVYLPPSFFWWWYHFDAYAPAVFIEGAALAPPAASSLLPSRSPARCGGLARRTGSPPMVRRAGSRRLRSGKPGSSPMPALCSAGCSGATSAMTGRPPLRRLQPAHRGAPRRHSGVLSTAMSFLGL
jgi:hypothetical protein